MKNRFFLGILATVGFFISCENKTTLIEQGSNTINLDVALECTKEIKLSQLSDSLECISLETNESSLLGGIAYVVYADDQNIFICSNHVLYRFGANGEFLNKIGQKGDAPGQYARLYSSTSNKTFDGFLFYIGQKRVQFWGYDGAFRKEIKLSVEGEVTTVSLVGNDRIVAEGRKYSDEGLEVNIYYFDLEGNLLKEKPMRRDGLTVDRIMYTSAIMYGYGDNVLRYKDINDEILYSLSKDSIAKQWTLNLGKYMPSREYLEDVSKRGTLLKDFAQVDDIRESSTYFYFVFVYKQKYWGVVVNKKSGQLEHSQEIKNPYFGGIENDYLKGCFFWLTFIDDSNTMYALLQAENALNCKDVQRYLSGKFQLTEDSNPVVVKVRGR